jgi:hypothetical protein
LQVYIKREGLPGTVNIGLFHASGGEPTGNALVSTTFNGDAISDSYQNYTLDVTESGMQGGLEYAIVMAAPSGTAADYIMWGIDAGGGLADAVYGTSSDGGLTWDADSPKDALFAIWGNPSIQVYEAKVFTGYLDDDDWLIVADVNNVYLPYYPYSDPQTQFQLQLILADGVTVKSSKPFTAWQRQPLSLYLNSAAAGALDWGGAYKIRVQLLSDSDIYTEYALTDSDWQAGSLLYLDGYVRNLAGAYGTYYSTLNGSAVTYIESSASNSVLNADGGVMFLRGIPLLSTVRPNLFKYTSSTMPTNPNEISTRAADTRVVMSDRVGPQIYGMLEGFGDAVGLDPVEFASALCWGLLILCGLLCGVGQFAGGIIAGLGFLGAGIVFGAITFAMIGTMVLLAIVVIGLRIFINNSG